MRRARAIARLIRVTWLIRWAIVPSIHRIARIHRISPVRGAAGGRAGGNARWAAAGQSQIVASMSKRRG